MDLRIPGIENAIPIGRGGFGTVYRAWQPEFRRMVAVKVLTFGPGDTTSRSRFKRELHAVGMLSGHPHIVTVHAAGVTSDGDSYLLMGYEEGGSLADRLRRSGRLAIDDVLEIGVKIAGALGAAHAAGILHRDLKPENILLSGSGELKLADFGIARLVGSTATGTGMLAGTFIHTAPELLAGASASAASDVYGLGSTLYTLISGRPPFAAGPDVGFIQLILRIARDPVPDLRPTGVPDHVCLLLERMMAKRPEHRPPSAEQCRLDFLSASRDGRPDQRATQGWPREKVRDPGTPISRAGTRARRRIRGTAAMPRRRLAVALLAIGGTAGLSTGLTADAAEHAATPRTDSQAQQAKGPSSTDLRGAAPDTGAAAATGPTCGSSAPAESYALVTFPSLSKYGYSGVADDGGWDLLLQRSMVHYTGSAAPGALGNDIIAFHREPNFQNIDQLVPGAIVEVQDRNCTVWHYRITSQQTLAPNQVTQLGQTSDVELTLITSTPWFQDYDRMVWRAVLVDKPTSSPAPPAPTSTSVPFPVLTPAPTFPPTPVIAPPEPTPR